MALLSANVNLTVSESAVYQEVSAHMFEDQVSIGTKLQLFFFQYTSVVSLDFQT